MWGFLYPRDSPTRHAQKPYRKIWPNAPSLPEGASQCALQCDDSGWNTLESPCRSRYDLQASLKASSASIEVKNSGSPPRGSRSAYPKTIRDWSDFLAFWHNNSRGQRQHKLLPPFPIYSEVPQIKGGASSFVFSLLAPQEYESCIDCQYTSVALYGPRNPRPP